jgi:hypothetical protein
MGAKNSSSQPLFSAICTLFSANFPIIGFYLINNNDSRGWILIQHSLEPFCRASNQLPSGLGGRPP